MKISRFEKFFLSSLLLSFLLCSPADAVVINMNQLNALANTCVKLIQSGDYHGAALLFHYPGDYSESELEADIQGVASSLRLFAEEFGEFGDVSRMDRNTLYVNIFASGGTHEYWDQHKAVMKIELQTEFSNFGKGYLIVQLVHIVGTLEVKAVAYGLPVSGESVGRIRQVGERMVALMQDQSSAN